MSRSYAIEHDALTASGLRAVVIYGRTRCGYVAVPADHATYGVGYSAELPCIAQAAVDGVVLGVKSPILLFTATANSETGSVRRSLDILIDVHGGITYSSNSPESARKYPVELEDSEPAVWWFGFDCAHYQDNEPGGRSLEYCIAECERMAAQLVAIKKA